MRGFGYIPDPRRFGDDMKKLISIAAGLLFAVAAVAGPDSFKFVFGTIATNSATSGIVTNSYPAADGYIDMVIVDIAGTSTNVDIDIVTKAASGTGPSRTILSTNDMTADITLYPRIYSLNTTVGGNATTVEGTRIPLVSDTVQCWMQAETTGVTAQVWIILSETP
jgi:hypothetical protein